MIVKKSLYNEVRRVFPSQVIEYRNLPKNIDSVINVMFQYSKGGRISDIQLVVREIPNSMFGSKVIKLESKGVKGNYYLVQIPFFKIYHINNEELYKELSRFNPQFRDKEGMKLVKAKRTSLKELTEYIAAYILSNIGELNRLEEDKRKDLGKGIIEDEYHEMNKYADESKSRDGGGYHQPYIRGTVDGIGFEIKDMSLGDFGRVGHLELGNYKAEYEFVEDTDYEESNIPTKYTKLVEKLNRQYKMIFSTKEGLDRYNRN